RTGRARPIESRTWLAVRRTAEKLSARHDRGIGVPRFLAFPPFGDVRTAARRRLCACMEPSRAVRNARAPIPAYSSGAESGLVSPGSQGRLSDSDPAASGRRALLPGSETSLSPGLRSVLGRSEGMTPAVGDVVAKVNRRLIPFFFLYFFMAFLDRINGGFAAL